MWLKKRGGGVTKEKKQQQKKKYHKPAYLLLDKPKELFRKNCQQEAVPGFCITERGGLRSSCYFNHCLRASETGGAGTAQTDPHNSRSIKKKKTSEKNLKDLPYI